VKKSAISLRAGNLAAGSSARCLAQRSAAATLLAKARICDIGRMAAYICEGEQLVAWRYLSPQTHRRRLFSGAAHRRGLISEAVSAP